MHSLVRSLDCVNVLVGRCVRWLTVLLVLVQFGVVVLRYIFGTSYMAAQESIIYIHAIIFMAGAGYTLLKDGHVRVDIFYSDASRRTRALVDFLGGLLLLIPSCLVLLYYTWGFVVQSWRILEGPISVGGIPAVFLLKSLIPIFAGLLLLQGIAMVLRNLLVLFDLEGEGAPQ